MSTKALSTYVTFKVFNLFRDRLLPIINEYRKDKSDNSDLFRHLFLSPESYSKRRAFQVKGVLSPFVCLWASSPLTYNKTFYSRSVLPQYFEYIDCKKCDECLETKEDYDIRDCPGYTVQKGFLYDYEKKFELSASSYFANFRASIEQDLLDFDRLRYFDVNVDELLPGYSCKVELLLDTISNNDNVDQISGNRSFDLGAKYTLKITLPVLSNPGLFIEKVNLYLATQNEWLREVTEVSAP